MARLILCASLPMLACAIGCAPAHADIYTWVDTQGIVNVSNVAPPPDARVTRVTHETPQAVASRGDAAREAARQAQVQALADRVQQLETALETTQRVVSSPAPPPPIAYVHVPTPVLVPYETQPLVPVARSCDPSWYGCWAAGFGWYPPSVVVVSGLQSRRIPPGHRPHPAPFQRTVAAVGTGRR